MSEFLFRGEAARPGSRRAVWLWSQRSAL